MNISLNRERLAATFVELCLIESPSRNEGRICSHLREIFAKLGAKSIYEDNSKDVTGAEVGNLIISFAGRGRLAQQEGFLLTCHMDTVTPVAGIEVVRNGELFTSAGETILGSDDKAGIAAIIELFTVLNETNSDHPPIEVIITVCEELGLVGAKHLEFNKIRSKYGYALDASGIDKVIIAAPAALKFEITVTGRASHAGLDPESGISALSLAAKALARLEVGKLDESSTRNFGVIEGGEAFNIIPETVKIRGEIRSHDEEKLQYYFEEIDKTFQNVMDNWQPTSYTKGFRPHYIIEKSGGYPALKIDTEGDVISRVRSAEKALEKKLLYLHGGGGSDANIFCDKGIPTVIIASGMNKVHTVDEYLQLNDLVSLTELLLALTIVEAPLEERKTDQ